MHTTSRTGINELIQLVEAGAQRVHDNVSSLGIVRKLEELPKLSSS